jgi:hypothetical protein
MSGAEMNELLSKYSVQNDWYVGKMPISISVLAAADGLLSADQSLWANISAPCQVTV